MCVGRQSRQQSGVAGVAPMRGRRTGEMGGAGAKKKAVAEVANTTEEVVDSEGEELDVLRVGGGNDINIGHVTATATNNVGGTKEQNQTFLMR